MSTITLTLTNQQAVFLADLLAQGIDCHIFHDIEHDETPSSILEAWRKEQILWKKDPFRGIIDSPRTQAEARVAESERKLVDFQSRILARVIASTQANEGGAS
ncbi:MAG TPA: hypothetical protein PLN52_23405 [Opitutaceae bacterium]|nr:hypothetical protein [Opitutaceae bacterium]